MNKLLSDPTLSERQRQFVLANDAPQSRKPFGIVVDVLAWVAVIATTLGVLYTALRPEEVSPAAVSATTVGVVLVVVLRTVGMILFVLTALVLALAAVGAEKVGVKGKEGRNIVALFHNSPITLFRRMVGACLIITLIVGLILTSHPFVAAYLLINQIVIEICLFCSKKASRKMFEHLRPEESPFQAVASTVSEFEDSVARIGEVQQVVATRRSKSGQAV